MTEMILGILEEESNMNDNIYTLDISGVIKK